MGPIDLIERIMCRRADCIEWEPFAPYHLLVSGLIAGTACVLLLILLLHALRRRERRQYFPNRLWSVRGLISSILLIITNGIAMASLVIAAWNPVRQDHYSTDHQAMLVVVLDVSDSVTRDGDWPEIRYITREFVRRSLEDVPEDALTSTAASLITFQSGVRADTVRLGELINKLNRLTSADFAAGEGSDIGAALQRAGRLIEDQGGRGLVLLVSDGNDTVGEVLDAAHDLGQRGIPVTVLPVGSRAPRLAINSANLPNQTSTGDTATLRVVLANNTATPTQARLDIHYNLPALRQTSANPDAARATTTMFEDTLDAQSYLMLRQPLEFEGLGLQYVDAVLTDVKTATPIHQRRFYTHVTRPLALLAVGHDMAWIMGIAPEFATVTPVAPDQIWPGFPFDLYDSIVIDSVPASDFRPDVLAQIARSVDEDHLGLFIINGDHAGRDEEEDTVLKTYDTSPLTPLLPVSSEPREIPDEPPPRRVVIVVDASDSMAGTPLNTSKAIIHHIVRKFLRPVDTLDVLVFTVDAEHIVDNQPMTDAGMIDALARVDKIEASGGTDPAKVMEQVQSTRLGDGAPNAALPNCGLVLITDGLFERDIASYRPDCRATIFMVGQDSQTVIDRLSPLAEPIPVMTDFDLNSIHMEFFEPKPRERFFETGLFPLMAYPFALDKNEALPIPAFDLDGAAITYLRSTDDDSLQAVRPRLGDPVLAYHDVGQSQVGVFTSSFNLAWFVTPEGQQAVEAWLRHTVAYAQRNRYHFQVEDHGSSLALEIAIVGDSWRVPDVTGLDVTLAIADTTHSIKMEMSSDTRAVFHGVIDRTALEGDLTPDEQDALWSQPAALIIEETTGADALPREQVVPIVIPPADSLPTRAGSEAASYGINENILRQVTELTGGHYAPPEGKVALHNLEITEQRQSYWYYWTALGIGMYLLAIFISKIS